MNATFTRKPTVLEQEQADLVSTHGRKLVFDYGTNVADNQEWNNMTNVGNTKTALLAYIGALEARVRGGTEEELRIQTVRAIEGGVLPPVGKPYTGAPQGAHGTKDRFPWEPT